MWKTDRLCRISRPSEGRKLGRKSTHSARKRAMRRIPLRGFRSFPARRIAIFPTEGKNLRVRRPPVHRPAGLIGIAPPPRLHVRRSGATEAPQLGGALWPRRHAQARCRPDAAPRPIRSAAEDARIIDRDANAATRMAAARRETGPVDFPAILSRLFAAQGRAADARRDGNPAPSRGAGQGWRQEEAERRTDILRQPAPPRPAAAIGGAAAIHERDKPAPRPARETRPHRIP